MVGNESMAGMDDVLNDPDTEEALAEFDLILSESSEGAGEARTAGDGADWGLGEYRIGRTPCCRANTQCASPAYKNPFTRQ